MPLKSYKLVVKTAEHRSAGTKAEVRMRFVGEKGRTEWLLCADHPHADIRADLCSGSTVRTMVTLPELGEVTACCVVLRGTRPDEWHPQSVEISKDNKSYTWKMSGRLTNDHPVAWHSPAVLKQHIPAPFGSWEPSALANAEERMARIKSEWEVSSPDAVTPRQAVAEIAALLCRRATERQVDPDA